MGAARRSAQIQIPLGEITLGGAAGSGFLGCSASCRRGQRRRCEGEHGFLSGNASSAHAAECQPTQPEGHRLRQRGLGDMASPLACRLRLGRDELHGARWAYRDRERGTCPLRCGGRLHGLCQATRRRRMRVLLGWRYAVRHAVAAGRKPGSAASAMVSYGGWPCGGGIQACTQAGAAVTHSAVPRKVSQLLAPQRATVHERGRSCFVGRTGWDGMTWARCRDEPSLCSQRCEARPARTAITARLPSSEEPLCLHSIE